MERLLQVDDVNTVSMSVNVLLHLWIPPPPLMPEVDAVHKVTVIPRGPALGVTQLLPEEELYHLGESRLHAQLVSYRNQ